MPRRAKKRNSHIGRRSGRRSRCAIYTRVSTPDQANGDFTSIDNQREACEAYIASQKHEGWVCTAERYDDTGFSGGKARV